MKKAYTQCHSTGDSTNMTLQVYSNRPTMETAPDRGQSPISMTGLLIPEVQCQGSPSVLEHVCGVSYLALCHTWLPRECHTRGTHSPQCPASSARERRRNSCDRAPRPSAVHASYLHNDLSSLLLLSLSLVSISIKLFIIKLCVGCYKLTGASIIRGKQTDIIIAILHCPTGGRVINSIAANSIEEN